MVFLYKPHARRSRSGRQYAHHKSKKRGFQTLATYQPLSKTYVFVLEAYGYVRPFDSFFPGGLSSRPALSPGCEAQLCRRASTRRSRERVLFRNGRSGSSLGGGEGGLRIASGPASGGMGPWKLRSYSVHASVRVCSARLNLLRSCSSHAKYSTVPAAWRRSDGWLPRGRGASGA